EPPWEEEIIGVENGDKRRSRDFDGMVAGGRRPPVLLHHNDTQPARTVIRCRRRARRMLGGTVIDYDHLVASRLSPGGAYSHSDCPGGILRGNDHADAVRHIHAPSSHSLCRNRNHENDRDVEGWRGWLSIDRFKIGRSVGGQVLIAASFAAPLGRARKTFALTLSPFPAQQIEEPDKIADLEDHRAYHRLPERREKGARTPVDCQGKDQQDADHTGEDARCIHIRPPGFRFHECIVSGLLLHLLNDTEPETFLQACTIGLWQALHETLVSFLRFSKSLTPGKPDKDAPIENSAHFRRIPATLRPFMAVAGLAGPPGATIAVKFRNFHRLQAGKMTLRSNVLHCKIFKLQTAACRFFCHPTLKARKYY